MGRLLFVFFVSCVVQGTFAQTKKNDLNSCKRFFLYSDSLQATDKPRSYGYAKQALAIGKKWANDSIVSLAYRRMAAALRSYRPKELYEDDSLAVVYAYPSRNAALIFNTLQLYGTDLLNDNQVQKSAAIVNNAVTLADSLKVPAYQTKIYGLKAFWFFKQFKMKESLAWYNNALQVAKLAGNAELIAAAKLGVANGHIYSGRADSASSYIFEAIEYYSHQKNLFELGDSYDVLAFDFQVRGNIAKATEYYQTAAATYEAANEPVKVADKYLSLAGLSISRSKFNEARDYIVKAEGQFNRLHNMTGVAMAKNYWGQYYTALGMKDSASFFFAASKKISHEIQLSLLEFANTGYELENKTKNDPLHKYDSLTSAALHQAAAIYPGSLVDSVINKVSRQNGFTEKQRQANRLSFSKQNIPVLVDGIHEPQLNTFTGFPPSADSSIALQYNRQLLDLEAKYKLRSKDDSIHLKDDSLQVAQQQNKLASQEVKQKNLVIAVVALSALLITLLAWQQYRDRKKADMFRSAEEENRRRAEQNEATIQKLQKDIIHRVDNMLQQVNALVGHTQESSKDQASFEVLKNRLEPLGALYNIFKQNNLSEWIGMQPYLQEICNNICFVFDADHKVSVTVDAPVSIKNTTAEKIGLIVNELVFNAFKYAFANEKSGTINIKLTQQPDRSYHLTVKDNGKGLPDNIKSGRGLNIIEELTETLRGQLHMQNDNGAGFEIIFM